MRRHIPSYQIQPLSRVYVIPRDATTPRGPKLEPIPLAGMEVVVDDYLFGCIQRGALTACGPEEPDELAALAALAALTAPEPPGPVPPVAEEPPAAVSAAPELDSQPADKEVA